MTARFEALEHPGLLEHFARPAFRQRVAAYKRFQEHRRLLEPFTVLQRHTLWALRWDWQRKLPDAANRIVRLGEP